MSPRIRALLPATAVAAIIGAGARLCDRSRRHRRDDRRGRRRADVSLEEHHRERRQFEGPHDARRRGEGRRPGRDAPGRRPVHGLRAGQRRLREASGRHGRDAAQAGEQGQARRRSSPITSCRATGRPKRSWPRSKKGGGKATLKTVAGGTLTFAMKDGKLWVVRRVRRHRPGDHRRRQPVERRHPRHRHGASAEDGLITSPPVHPRPEGSGPRKRAASRVWYAGAVAWQRLIRPNAGASTSRTSPPWPRSTATTRTQLSERPMPTTSSDYKGNDKLWARPATTTLSATKARTSSPAVAATTHSSSLPSRTSKSNLRHDHGLRSDRRRDSARLPLCSSTSGSVELDAEYFHIGKKAKTRDDHIILDAKTGRSATTRMARAAPKHGASSMKVPFARPSTSLPEDVGVIGLALPSALSELSLLLLRRDQRAGEDDRAGRRAGRRAALRLEADGERQVA